MGCFVRGSKNGMGCFVRGDKNCMGCFVRGGKLMRDVLSGVAKNGMGCFVPGCFVLHSYYRDKFMILYYFPIAQNTGPVELRFGSNLFSDRLLSVIIT